jgi:peptidyl-prolyl cis-trans isomerase C
MRRHAVRAAAWLLAAGAAAPAQTPPAAPAQPAVAATVNGQTITLDEVDAVIRKAPPFATPLTPEQIRKLRAAVANDMADDLLLRQFLKQHAPPVEPGELDQHMMALAESQRKAGKTLADFFRETRQTEAQVRDGWAALIQFQRLVDRQATDAELRKYHADNKEFFDRVTVRAAHIVVRVGPAAPPAERAAAVAKLRQLRADILAGRTTFAAAAKAHSVDPTAAAGGDLGYIARRDTVVDEAVARAAFAVKVGEVSEPVETEYGVHLVTATDRRAGRPARFEDVADLVRDCYADDVRQGLIAKLRKQGDVRVTVP